MNDWLKDFLLFIGALGLNKFFEVYVSKKKVKAEASDKNQDVNDKVIAMLTRQLEARTQELITREDELEKCEENAQTDKETLRVLRSEIAKLKNEIIKLKL